MITKKDIKRDLVTVKVLLMRAEAMVTNIVKETNSKDLKEFYRKLASLTSHIDKLDS